MVAQSIGFFKFNVAEIAEGGVASPSIIEALKVGKDVPASFGRGAVVTAVHQLAFQRSKEALPGGIVVAVALTAHTGDHVMSLLELSVGMSAALAAAVRVVQQSGWRLAISNRHFQSCIH